MRFKPFLFIGLFLSLSFHSYSQIEGAYVDTKEFKAFGFGAHLNFKFPVTEASYLTTEAGFYLFRKDGDMLGMIPLLLGYQRTLDGSGTGLFVEPLAGYTFGGSDVQRHDENGAPIPDPSGNGEWMQQQAQGLTAGLATGYIFPGNTPVTFGLRYQRVFVQNDPGVNLVSLRLTWPLFGGRKEY